ncbi:MAG TPA: hypothetical protein VFG51_00445 [Candidatus Saccharimonadia bacterium]|nr:hypothetical protein [Candidatus Saccharimonadia bacterium]
MNTSDIHLRTAVCAITVALGLCTVAPYILAASPSPSPSSATRVRATASPSPSPSPSPVDSATVDQNIKDRIQQVIDQNKTDTGTGHLIKRAFVGQIQKVNAEAITMRTLHAVETARITPNTVMLLMPAMTTLQEPDVELNAYAIAMGYLADDGVLDVRRLLVSPTPLFPPDRKIILGILQANTTKNITVQSRTNEQLVISVSTKTRYEDVDGNKAIRTDFKADTNVLVSIENPSNASSAATLVREMK